MMYLLNKDKNVSYYTYIISIYITTMNNIRTKKLNVFQKILKKKIFKNLIFLIFLYHKKINKKY